MRESQKLVLPCGCDADQLGVVHRYLKEAFPEFTLRDFHAPTRLMQAGVVQPGGQHHVVSIECMSILTYYAVLLRDFLQRPLSEAERCLRSWNLAQVLRATRIAIVSSDGADGL